MICPNFVLPYHQDVICNSKYIWHIIKYFIYFSWNILPASTAPNGKCLYWYLPNGHENVVRYDDCLSNLRLWYSELVSMIDMYCTLFSLGKISLSVRPYVLV